MSIRVSIIVPVYNSHATLPKCLDSLIAQTYQDLEIICVNDKSEDNSIDIIKEYQQKDNRVILINHTENMNAGGARNSGIRNATGEYVCFCDNDDWMNLDAIEVLVDASEKGRIDLVVPQWCEFFSDCHKTDKQNLIIGGSKEENCKYALLNGCRILGCLIRKEIFSKYDLFYPEKTFFEDNAIGMALIFSANEIKVVDKLLYYYQMVEGSSSRSISLDKIIDRIKTSGLFVSNMERCGYINNNNRSLVEYHYLCYSYRTIWMLANLGTQEAKKQLSVVADKVSKFMPNEYMLQYHKDYILRLKYPFLYFFLLNSIHKYRIMRDIVHFFRTQLKYLKV